MKWFLIIPFVFLAFACTKNSGRKAPEQLRSGPITLVIHGGAGTILRSNMSAESEAAYHQKLQDALDTGFAVLENGGKSLEAVIEQSRFWKTRRCSTPENVPYLRTMEEMSLMPRSWMEATSWLARLQGSPQ